MSVVRLCGQPQDHVRVGGDRPGIGAESQGREVRWGSKVVMVEGDGNGLGHDKCC